jgi:hypothetical protein
MKRLGGLAAVGALLIIASPAEACKCAGAIQATTEAVQSADRAIVAAIKQMAGQVSGNVEIGFKSLGNLIDTTYQRMVERQRQEISGRAVQTFVPSLQTCQTVTGINGAIALRINAEASRAAQAAQAVRWAEGARGSGASSRAEASTTLSNRLRTNNCTPREAELGICSIVRPELSGAHLLPLETILTPRAYKTKFDSQSARDAAVLLANPLPPDPLPADAYRGDTRGRILARQNAIAMINLGQSVLNTAIADRDPIADKAWADYVAAWLKSVFPQGAPAGSGDIASQRALMEMDVKRRHASAAWQTSVQNMETAQIQREGLAIAAQQSDLLYGIGERLERIELLLAANTAAQGRKLQEDLATLRENGADIRTLTEDPGANNPRKPDKR